MKKKLYTLLRVTLLLCGLFPVTAAVADTPPTEHSALFDWLSSGAYKSWTHESAAHPSAGPHPQAVIAYLNPALDESLTAGNAAHPQGSAAVKELYNDSGALSGWAVSVKTDADSAGGKGWYWYEILGTTADSRVVANGNGVPLCFGCHTPGKDFVLIPHPLK